MKNVLFIILCMCLVSFVDGPQKTVISGQVSGIEVNSVYYVKPLEGTTYNTGGELVPVDADGRFRIELDLQEPVFIEFGLRGIPMTVGKKEKYGVCIPVHPGKDLQLRVYNKEDKNLFLVSGPEEAGLNLYASLENPSSFYTHYREFLKNYSMEEIAVKMKELKEQEIRRFQALKDKGAISDEFYRLVETERDCHYAYMESYFHLYNASGEKLSRKLEKYLEELYKQYPPDDERLMVSPLWYSYASSYVINFRLLQEGISGKKNEAKLRTDGTIFSTYVEEGMKYLTGNRKEYFAAVYIYNRASSENFEKELVPLFDTFHGKYPESVYLSFLEPSIENIRTYYEKAEDPFISTVRLVENAESINTLAEAVAIFPGKKVYVDVWATWCGPCKGQFAYKKELKEWLAENEYEILYISLDHPSMKETWENMVKYYELEGHHILAGEDFQNELKRLQNRPGGGYFVPWYFLVGENGEIEQQHALPPSAIAEQKNKQ